MQRSESITEIAKALSAFQGKLKTLPTQLIILSLEANMLHCQTFLTL